MNDLKVTTISIEKIFAPQAKVTDAPKEVLQEMADEIKADGWPKGKELGVKHHEKVDKYEVHASFSWFEAGLMAGIKEIPCVIY